MLSHRVIPCLLLKNRGLVKTVKYDNPRYVGDPINTVRIFNEKEAEEIIFLDIQASKEQRAPLFEQIAQIAGECFMPFCYGGGIRTIEEIREILLLGAEKVSLNSAILSNPDLVRRAAEVFGSQSIVVSIDVKKSLLGGYKVYDCGQRTTTRLDPVTFAVEMQERGAGEIFLNSVDRDGTFSGYDIEMIKRITSAVHIPVIACGGARSVEDLKKAIREGGASAVAAGGMFVFHGKHKAVLINYLTRDELTEISN